MTWKQYVVPCIATIATAVVGSAYGAEPQLDDLKACAAISGPTERLLCYDKLQPPPNTPEPTPEVKDVRDSSAWRHTDEADRLDGSRMLVALVLASDNSEPGSAAFYIRCLKGKTEVFATWPKYLGARAVAVRWRADEMPVRGERWSPASDGRAAFHPNPIQFVKSLSGKRELVLNMQPYNETASSLTFPIAGIDEAVKPIRAACKW